MEGVWLENANLLSVISASGHAALHTPQQFSRKVPGTDHLLSGFWTAGFTARPPYIGLARCTTIFQISNRAIMCIKAVLPGCMGTVKSKIIL